MGRSDVESLTGKLARSSLSQEEFWQIGIFLTQIAFDQMITRHRGVGHCGEVPVNSRIAPSFAREMKRIAGLLFQTRI